jgi:putative ABC transport system permease protein
MPVSVEPDELELEVRIPKRPAHTAHWPRRRMHPGELLVDLMRQTFANLRRNKLRSFLTLFGIAWGIASLVLMSALGDGFRQGQRKNMAQIGDNIVFLWGGITRNQAGGQRAGRAVRLTRDDVEILRTQCPSIATVSAEQKTRNVPARSATNSGRFLTLGVNPEYLKLRNLPVERGRAVSGADVREGRRVAVLGASVRKQLFEKKPAPLGELVYLNNYPYEIIGVMGEKEQNSSYDGWDNDKILVPDSSLLRDMPSSREVYAENRVWGVLYRPVSTDKWEAAQAEARAALGRVHGFDRDDEGALEIWDTIKSAQMFDSIFNAGEIFLAVVSLITLSLGGIGVMNTMMMAVAERTHEIGLKKALGATSRRILADFFLEGLFLALLSGAIGLLLVLGLTSLVNSLPMPVMFSGLPVRWTMLLMATGALGLVAIASALPPAHHAASLTPVEALRYER